MRDFGERMAMSFATALLCAALCSAFPGVRVASAALSPTDATNLTAALETLTTTWDNGALATASGIIEDTDYDASDFEAFFETYFNTQDHPVTATLALYLESKSFFWPTETSRQVLQEALIDPLWTRVTDIVAAHPSDLGTLMRTNANERETLFEVHRWFAKLAKYGTIDTPTRETIFDRYESHITTYPQYWSDETTIVATQQPLVPQLRLQVWLSFVGILPLTPTRKTDIATALELGGVSAPKLDIWDDHSVLVVENNGFSTDQLIAIDDLLSAVDPDLHNLGHISSMDTFYAAGSARPIVAKGQTGNLINYYFTLAGNQVAFGFDRSSGGLVMVTSSAPVVSGAWNHVVGTYDGSALRVYVNGVAAGSTALAIGPATSSTQPVAIGGSMFGTHMFGGIDGVKIYSRALSGAEVLDAFNGDPVSTTGLVAHWAFDESSGTSVADSSGNGHTGTNSGATITSGQQGNALLFDGEDDVVSIPDAVALRVSGDMTIEAWVQVLNEVIFPVTATDGVNVFDTAVGVPSNPFPPDISPFYTDAFTNVLAHELNHVVDAFTVVPDTALQSRKTALIAQADDVVLEWLRSNVLTGTGNDAYFVQFPQEVVAGLASDMFASSAHSLALALLRFDNGYHEPLNQVLYFLDIYSRGTNVTKFYTIDDEAAVTVDDVPVTRDANGHIDSLRVGGLLYQFTTEPDGDVTAYNVCGNGDVEAGEECDDGNLEDDDCCSSTCVAETLCDDGDACTLASVCHEGVCVPVAPQSCNDGNPCTKDTCNPTTGCESTAQTCPAAQCGNGVLNAGEECDDGNNYDGDCCSSRCTYEASGSACFDGSFCSIGDTCNGSGSCVPGTCSVPGMACGAVCGLDLTCGGMGGCVCQ
ncbi:MAG: hypothetical protein KIT14_00935 [bacterium]|nr:hypothetical protein [bacterium]